MVSQTAENDAIIEEMLTAESAPEPGDLKEKAILDRGDTSTLPSMVSQISSAGYVVMYDNRTGTPSLTNRNMLPAQLKKKRDDGSRIFTLKDPGFRPPQGTIKCMLHKDSPNRKHYDEMGLPVCPMEHIPSAYQLILHMKKRHKQEWAIIEGEQNMTKQQQERDFQMSVINLAQKAGNSRRRRSKPAPEVANPS